MSRPTQGTATNNTCIRLRGYHPLWPNFPVVFFFACTFDIAALQPQLCRNIIGLGSSPFARHYLGNHYCFLFLWALRCFSSPGVLYIPMYSVYSDWSSTSRVAPFGNPRIKTCLQFPVAYRSLSRPSSPVHAKASSIRHKLLKSCHFTWLELMPF